LENCCKKSIIPEVFTVEKSMAKIIAMDLCEVLAIG
jgi:hypothetical protein